MKYVALNPNADAVSKFHVDGKVITSENKSKCDYLVVDETKHLAIFIELKGRHTEHALVQIDATEKELKNDLKEFQKHYYRIVCTSVSAAFTTEEKKWIKKHDGELKKASRFYEDRLNKL